MIDYAKENIKLKDWYEQLMFYLRVRGLKKPTIECFFWYSKNNYNITDELPERLREARIINISYENDRANTEKFTILKIYLHLEE